jgi:hypothetical protein
MQAAAAGGACRGTRAPSQLQPGVGRGYRREESSVQRGVTRATTRGCNCDLHAGTRHARTVAGLAPRQPFSNARAGGGRDHIERGHVRAVCEQRLSTLRLCCELRGRVGRK